MNNRWIEINKKNLKEGLNLLVRDDLLKIVIDGSMLRTKNIYMEQIGKFLEFPVECEGRFSIFEDLIMDLGWLPEKKGICIWITDYQECLKEDDETKREFEEIFKDEVFPFWETEVTKVMKNGKSREFYVVVS